jgi:hypothetical protein
MHFYKIFVGKPEGTTPCGRPRHRWEHIFLRFIVIVSSHLLLGLVDTSSDFLMVL